VSEKKKTVGKFSRKYNCAENLSRIKRDMLPFVGLTLFVYKDTPISNMKKEVLLNIVVYLFFLCVIDFF
jgi:patatin-like phospholipase/acyl hydrolase